MTLYECSKCGRDDIDGRGKKGHAKFSGGPHGEKMELPDDWEDWFSPVDDDSSDEADEADDEPVDDGGDSSEGQDTSSSSTPADGRSGGQTSDRLKKALFDDVRHLWRSDL